MSNENDESKKKLDFSLPERNQSSKQPNRIAFLDNVDKVTVAILFVVTLNFAITLLKGSPKAGQPRASTFSTDSLKTLALKDIPLLSKALSPQVRAPQLAIRPHYYRSWVVKDQSPAPDGQSDSTPRRC